MAITPRLEMRQGQALVMTPQLQQAIKLLQLSAVELAAFVEEELERNPLLERAEPEPQESPPAEAEKSDEEYREDAPDIDPDQLHPDLTLADHAAAGTDWSKSGVGGHEDLPDFEASLTRAISLSEHLEAQLAAAGVTPAQRLIGLALIDSVDPAGYCRADLSEIAETLGCAEDAILCVLTIMQGFEPVGIMARSLQECLSLQLADRGRLDPAMQALLARLDLVARRDYARLMVACGVDREDLDDMIAELRALTPKPGASFDCEPAQTIVPDIYVRPGADGAWSVELNSDALPKVLMNTRYHAQVSRKAMGEDDKLFLSGAAANANWLIKSLDQRAQTILKVAREIVRQQDGFLAFGVEHLRPLNLKTVAAGISMHESTVSRVTANKYMATPRGVFELKYFFTAAIASADGGEAHSAEAVRHRIKALVEQEKPDQILSDDRIVEILRASGIDIARRTVAKYRESLHIPSSLERKRRGGPSV